MRFAWPPRGLRAEAVAARGRMPRWLYSLGIGAQSWLQALAERFDLKIGAYDAPAYRAEVRRNSDHRKIADTLAHGARLHRGRERRDRGSSRRSACAATDRLWYASGRPGADDLPGVLARAGPPRALHRRRRWRLRARGPPAQGAAAGTSLCRPNRCPNAPRRPRASRPDRRRRPVEPGTAAAPKRVLRPAARPAAGPAHAGLRARARPPRPASAGGSGSPDQGPTRAASARSRPSRYTTICSPAPTGRSPIRLRRSPASWIACPLARTITSPGVIPARAAAEPGST